MPSSQNYSDLNSIRCQKMAGMDKHLITKAETGRKLNGNSGMEAKKTGTTKENR